MLSMIRTVINYFTVHEPQEILKRTIVFILRSYAICYIANTWGTILGLCIESYTQQLQTAGLVLLGIFVLMFMYSYYLEKTGKPVLIINQEGIWVKHHGTIPWENISEIDIFYMPSSSLKMLGIALKDPFAINAQTSFSGKCNLFWARLLNYRYQINICNTDLDDDEILVFARQFLR